MLHQNGAKTAVDRATVLKGYRSRLRRKHKGSTFGVQQAVPAGFYRFTGAGIEKGRQNRPFQGQIANAIAIYS